MDAETLFKQKFDTAETPLKVYCPYRIAPVGAHSDYQHGLISGFAIDEGVTLAFLPTNDGTVKLYSANFDGAVEFSAYELAQRSYDWGDFAKAAYVSVKRKHRVEMGMIGVIHGSLPVGGLSSSAAVLISYITAICKINGISLTRAELIDFALYAEHDYLEMKKIPSKRPEFITKRMDRSARKEEETVTTWLNVLRACYEGSTTEELELKKPRMTIDTKGQPAVIGIDYADIRDFASAGVLTKTESGEYIWRQHTWICAESPFLDSIKFPLKNIGQTEFNDFEVVPGPVIDVNSIVDWCMERCAEYDVKKIAMDTYRYTLFKMAFEERGLTIEDRKNPNGVVRLIRKITSATGIIAPFIQSMFSQGMINFGASAIMRWYTNNTSVTEDKFGNKMFGKVEPKLRKNDGFMAFDVAMFCKDELEVQIIYI